MSTGWGEELWGEDGWGGDGPSAGLFIVSAQAVAENVVQLIFSEPIYFSQLEDPEDGSVRTHYTITNNPETIGADGNASRPVSVASVALGSAQGLGVGQVILLTTDRPMSPSAAEYTVACTGLVSASLTDAVDTSPIAFFGVFKVIVTPQINTPNDAHTRDIANPQTLSAAQSIGVAIPTGVVLGTFPIDTSGDYASDSGLTSYKKRCFRRIFTKPGAFLHLGQSYGVGITTYGKKLGTGANRNALAAACEAQIGQEPETASVKVTVTPAPNTPGSYMLTILAKLKSGQGVKMQMVYRPQ